MATFKTLKDPTPLKRARRLRREDTPSEARLWNALRAHRLGGWKWRRQVPKGPFILDFFCPEAALVVELDGGQHSEQQAYDARRTAYLESLGLRVLRFWNSAVMENRDGVCLSILDPCGGAHSSVASRWTGRTTAVLRRPSPYPLPPRFAGGEE
jgi:very-short-patch-repair endonuclease